MEENLEENLKNVDAFVVKIEKFGIIIEEWVLSMSKIVQFVGAN